MSRASQGKGRKRAVNVGLIFGTFCCFGIVTAQGPLPANAAPSWPAWVSRPAAVACPSGSTAVLPTNGWTDSLGVGHFTYQDLPGFTTTVAPRLGSSARVTPKLLADLGLPSSASVANINELGNKSTAAAFCRTSTTSVSPSGSFQTHRDGPNWAGYALTESEYGSQINSVTGAWTVGQSQTTASPSAESTWIGIGGGLGEGAPLPIGLIQAGTSMMSGEGYRSWFEWIGENTAGAATGVGTQYVSTKTVKYTNTNVVRPGDQVQGFVWWSSTTSACFTFLDHSRSTGSFSGCQSKLGIQYDHTSAEWINERTEFSGSSYCPGDPKVAIYPSCYWYYDSPGTTSWTHQWFSAAENDYGPWSDPFSFPFEAEVMVAPTTHDNPTPSCSSAEVLAYPVNALATSPGGQSQTLFCRSGSMWYFGSSPSGGTS